MYAHTKSNLMNLMQNKLIDKAIIDKTKFGIKIKFTKLSTQRVKLTVSFQLNRHTFFNLII